MDDARSLALPRPATIAGLDRARLAELLCGLIGVALLLVDAARLYQWVHRNPAWRLTTDFGIYVRASERIGDGGTPYFEGDLVNGVWHAYIYPPLFAELMLPLTHLPDNVLRYGWVAMITLCAVAAVVLLLRGFGRVMPWGYVTLILGVMFAAEPARMDLYQGQVNFPLLLLSTLALWCFWRARPKTAGVLWGLTFIVKPFLGVFVLYLIWRRAWAAVAWSVGTAAALFALSFAILIPIDTSAVSSFRHVSSYYAGAPRTTSLDNHALRGLIDRLFVDAVNNPMPWAESRALVWIASAALLVLLGGVLVYAARHAAARADNDAAPLLVAFAFVVGAGMVYGPLTQSQNLSLLLPGFVGAAFLALPSRGAMNRPWLVATLAWAALFATVVSPVARLAVANPDVVPGSPHGIVLLWTGRVGFILLAAVVLTAFALRRGAPRDDASPVG